MLEGLYGLKDWHINLLEYGSADPTLWNDPAMREMLVRTENAGKKQPHRAKLRKPEPLTPEEQLRIARRRANLGMHALAQMRGISHVTLLLHEKNGSPELLSYWKKMRLLPAPGQDITWWDAP